MTCRRSQEMLSAFVDGELDSAASHALTEHLADCADCAEELRILQQLIHTMGSTPRVACPDDVWLGLKRRIAEAPAPLLPRRQPSLAPSLAPAWAFAAVAAVGVCVLSPNPQSAVSSFFPASHPTFSRPASGTTAVAQLPDNKTAVAWPADRVAMGPVHSESSPSTTTFQPPSNAGSSTSSVRENVPHLARNTVQRTAPELRAMPAPRPAALRSAPRVAMGVITTAMQFSFRPSTQDVPIRGSGSLASPAAALPSHPVNRGGTSPQSMPDPQHGTNAAGTGSTRVQLASRGGATNPGHNAPSEPSLGGIVTVAANESRDDAALSQAGQDLWGMAQQDGTDSSNSYAPTSAPV